MKEKKLFIDQYGQKEFAYTIKELLSKCYATKAHKMYSTDSKGNNYHIGYVIKGRWFHMYAPIIKKIK